MAKMILMTNGSRIIQVSVEEVEKYKALEWVTYKDPKAKKPNRMSEAELIAFAKENGIDLGEAKDKAAMVAVIVTAQETKA